MLLDFSYDFKFFININGSIIFEICDCKKIIDIKYENIIALFPNSEEKILILKENEKKKIIKFQNDYCVELILNAIKSNYQEWAKILIDGYMVYLSKEIFEKFSANFWANERGLLLSKLEMDNIALYVANKADYIVADQVIKTFFSDVGCSLIVKYPAENYRDIKFIWITRGTYGDIKIISKNSNYISLKEILLYKERFQKISPIFEKAKICDSGCIKNLPRNWKYEYLGNGNNLLIHSSIYNQFKKEIESMKREDIGDHYLEKIFKILSQEINVLSSQQLEYSKINNNSFSFK